MILPSIHPFVATSALSLLPSFPQSLERERYEEMSAEAQPGAEAKICCSLCLSLSLSFPLSPLSLSFGHTGDFGRGRKKREREGGREGWSEKKAGQVEYFSLRQRKWKVWRRGSNGSDLR